MKRNAKQNLSSNVKEEGVESKDVKQRGRKQNKSRYIRKDGFKDKPYMKGPNDIAWRTGDEMLSKLSANLPFGVPAGLPQDFYKSPLSTSTATEYHQPGVAVCLVRLMLGNATDYNSPINLAARKIYSYIRHANSGSKNYEANDLALYFGAVGQLLGLLGWMQRTYTVATKFSSTNRYTPSLLLRGMGVDYDSVRTNLANFKYLIGWFGRAIGSLAFPDKPYFRACYEAFQYVFRDTDSPKEQFYMLSPAGFLKYNPTYSSNGGALDTTTTNPWYTVNSNQLLTYADIEAYVHELTDVVLGDEDCGIISGDILKAYGSEKLYHPQSQMEDYEVIIKSEEFAQQFHNIAIVRDADCIFSAYSQNSGAPNTAPFLEMTFGATYGSTFLANRLSTTSTPIDAFSAEPDYKEVINCTVLKAEISITNDSTTQNKTICNTLVCDLFWPTDVVIITDLAGGHSSLGDNFMDHNYMYAGLGPNGLLLTNFDWCPMFRYAGSSGLAILGGDIQNVRFFSHDVIKRIHENSTLSLFSFTADNFE